MATTKIRDAQAIQSVDLTSEVTNTLPVANGGTGNATNSVNAVLLGNGTGALQTVAPSTSGNVLTSDGTTWQSTAPSVDLGTVELGHASDTTLSRSAAGQLAVEGVDVLTTSNTKTVTGKTFTNPTVNNYTEGAVAIGSTGTAKTIDLTSGTVQTATLTGNCTFTMPTATAGKSFTLLLSTGAGSFTAAFTGVKWPTAGAPTITTAASKMDLLTFVSDGTNWYGAYVQGYTP